MDSASATPEKEWRHAAIEWRRKFAASKPKPSVRTAKNTAASPIPLSALKPVHPSNWSGCYGVSRWTVARRRKAGVKLDDIFQPVAASLPLEFEGVQYSATHFSKVYAISKGAVLAGIRAGKTADQILDARRKPGRPRCK